MDRFEISDEERAYFALERTRERLHGLSRKLALGDFASAWIWSSLLAYDLLTAERVMQQLPRPAVEQAGSRLGTLRTLAAHLFAISPLPSRTALIELRSVHAFQRRRTWECEAAEWSVARELPDLRHRRSRADTLPLRPSDPAVGVDPGSAPDADVSDGVVLAGVCDGAVLSGGSIE